MPDIKNDKLNFGITKGDLSSAFRTRAPLDKRNKKNAIIYIFWGADLFEIPKKELGIPLSMLELGNSVDILATYLGLGKIKRDDKISYKGDHSIDDLIKKDPYEILTILVNHSYENHNVIRIYQNKGFSDFKKRPSYAKRILSLSESEIEPFIDSLQIFKSTDYYKKPDKINIQNLFNLFSEIYWNKHQEKYLWDSEGAGGSRIKNFSETNEGILYITREFNTPSGKKLYGCDCPGFTYRKKIKDFECKHIKEIKAE